MNKLAVDGADVPLTLEERQALIERVAASEQFARSARLRDFLLYVGKQSLKEGCPEIRELEIGIRVFGRPDDYSRSADNIVRVNATELRKRVGLYFESTGAHEPFILEIPRGGYRLIFRPRRVESPAQLVQTVQEQFQTAMPHEPVLVPALTHRENAPFSGRIGIWLWPVLAIGLAILCVALYLQDRAMRRTLSPWYDQPALSAFWGNFLDPHRQTDLVLPDDSVSVMKDITRQPFTLDEYINRTFIGQVQSSNMSVDRKEDVNQILSHDLVTFGSVRAAQSLMDAIPTTYPRNLTLSRYFTSDQIKRENVILIGGRKSVPWDNLFKLNFVIDFDYTRGVALVRNNSPKPGEQAIYSSSAASAVISCLPNPSHTGKVILIAGVDSDATNAAAAFLISESKMDGLRRTFHTDQFPYFEVLLKSSQLSGTVFDTEVVSYRTYPNLH